MSRRTFTCRRNNLTIRGTEYRQEGNCRPIAIVSHGFMAFQDTVRQYAEAMAEMGYVSYCFDFCGGCVVKGKSDGSTTEMSVMTEVEDLKAVIHYAQSREYVNPEEIVLMGCSQGGFVSAIAASRLQDKISKLVLFYPALCIPDDARAGKMMFAKFDPGHIPDIVRCGPMKLGKCYVEDVIGIDPYQEIKEFTGDVLIVHGTRDKIVDIEYSKRAYELYLGNKGREDESRTVSFYQIDGGRHGFSRKHDRAAIRHLQQFLAPAR
ncbi:MAG: lysophospholipase [Acetatifactor sp.]|nr:lysophospholipase [Acetatifactor sp.]